MIWRYPELMAQWPFAHEYEMTYTLKDGVLEVRVTVTNLSRDAMPLSIGFHPYYRIPDVPRDEWTGHIPARQRVVADSQARPFICFEPMTGITSAVNLAHDGKYPDLQTIAPGGRWSESFWIRASGI